MRAVAEGRDRRDPRGEGTSSTEHKRRTATLAPGAPERQPGIPSYAQQRIDHSLRDHSGLQVRAPIAEVDGTQRKARCRERDTSAIDKFLERAGDWKREGKGYLTRCPAHADANPSLFMSENADGDVLLVCRSQRCSFDEIVQAFGLTRQDAFHHSNGSHEGRAPGSARGQGRPPFDHRHIVNVYEYVDEQNRPLFEVVRDRHKNFLQRRLKPGHRDPGEEPVYLYTLEGVRRVLYRLPEVAAARRVGHRIYLCEGEKDADALAALGLCATTAPQGAAAEWLAQYTDQLAGAREVIILPDNDEPGRKHATKVRDAIAEWVLRVKVLALPELPEKGDASDWIAAGGSREQLEELATAAAPFVTPAQRFTSIDLTLSEFMQKPYPKPRSYLADGLIGAGDLVFFYGRPGLGKTWAILQLAQAWAKGEGLYGLAGPEGGPLRVGLLELELGGWYLQNKRIPRITQDLGPWSENVRLVVRPDLQGAVDILADDWPSWSRWVRDRALDVILVDALSRAHQADENKAVEFGPVLRRLDELRFETNVAIVAVHHEPKMTGDAKERDDMDALRGTSRMQSDSNALIRLKAIKADEVFCLAFPKTNNAEPIAPIYLSRPRNGGFEVTDWNPEKRKTENLDKAREALFQAGRSGLTDEEIATRCGFSVRTAKRHREDLGAVQAGVQSNKGTGKGRKSVPVWRLADTDGHKAPCPSEAEHVTQGDIYD